MDNRELAEALRVAEREYRAAQEALREERPGARERYSQAQLGLRALHQAVADRLTENAEGAVS